MTMNSKHADTLGGRGWNRTKEPDTNSVFTGTKCVTLRFFSPKIMKTSPTNLWKRDIPEWLDLNVYEILQEFKRRSDDFIHKMPHMEK